MRVTLRPSIAADFIALIEKPPAWRCQCITAEADGEIIGVGGFTFPPGGDVWASVFMAVKARKYRVAVHRAGLMAMALARRRGFRRVYATAQPDNPAAERWLERLGFRAAMVAGEKVFIWEPCATTSMTR
jgi:RimJ/RimL family protein N-acetyltransferase